MRKIILASASEARQKLLKDINLKFQTAKADVKEKSRIRTNCRDLVIANALSKAEDVAKRFKTGIVVGADTIALAGKKIIGKPKNGKDAFRILKLLTRSPQWVYTGLAVIDIDNNKRFTDYEKTKVYMCRLSDEQIKRYLNKVNTLDKSGSFDIQGLGGVFIDRIEGCFYNVVGLPLAKLARILERTGIEIF